MLGDEPGLEEVMACVFGIQKHEVRTYQTLLASPASTVESWPKNWTATGAT